MMYSKEQDTFGRNRLIWKEHLVQNLPECENVVAASQREQIIDALSEFIAEKYGDGPVRSELIAQAYLRALSSLGHRSPSTKAMIEAYEDGGTAFDCDDLCQSPFAVAELIAVGWLKPMNGICQAAGQNWIYDLRPLAGTNCAALELRLFAELKLLIEKIAVIWDVSSGSGSLALRGLHAIVKELCGQHAQTEERHESLQEVICYCDDLFRKTAKSRGWNETPSISIRFI